MPVSEEELIARVMAEKKASVEVLNKRAALLRSGNEEEDVPFVPPHDGWISIPYSENITVNKLGILRYRLYMSRRFTLTSFHVNLHYGAHPEEGYSVWPSTIADLGDVSPDHFWPENFRFECNIDISDYNFFEPSTQEDQWPFRFWILDRAIEFVGRGTVPTWFIDWTFMGMPSIKGISDF